GQLLRGDLARPLLVPRIEEREEEDDGERFDFLESEPAIRAAERVLVERDDDLAAVIEPLGHADPPAPRTDRGRRREGGIPDVLLVAAAELDLVAMAFARHEPGHRA